MKEVFKYTFITISEWKKLLIIILSVSILTLLEALPVISIVTFIFEKMIYLSIGVFLIYLLKHSSTIEIYYENLQKNSIATFLFHFIPSAIGILLALMLISFFWIMFFIFIFQFTNSMFVFANPHQLLFGIAKTPLITKILIGFYSIYLMFYSYIFLGKLGDSLNKNSFKASFISMILSLIDFKYWIKTFNIKYFIIFIVWSLIIGIIYSLTSFIYLFVIFPQIVTSPNISLLIIPIFVAISTILTYFTYFSAYFANKTTYKI